MDETAIYSKCIGLLEKDNTVLIVRQSSGKQLAVLDFIIHKNYRPTYWTKNLSKIRSPGTR